MIYSEWGGQKGCIVNFVEGKSNAFIWAEQFYYQYHDRTSRYLNFHMQEIDVILRITCDRNFNFHPSPEFTFSNGYGSIVVIPVDHDLRIDELMQIPEFDASIFPLGDLLDRQLEHEYLICLIENN